MKKRHRISSFKLFSVAYILITMLPASLLYAQNGGEICATATVIPSIPYTAVGTTAGAVDDYYASCPDVGNQGGAPDVVYEYTNGSASVNVDISLCVAVTDYDCQLYIYQNSCTGTPVACQEDGCQSPSYTAAYNSRITAFTMAANTTYFIVVDGYNASAMGNFQIDIAPSVGIFAPDSTNLPLILINTNNQQIVDEPKIDVDMKIIDYWPDSMNHPGDVANVYDGKAGIEIRGAYSASLPQKPYGLETRDVNGMPINVPLLGMPPENDWILLANYNDKTFLRNILSFHLFHKMGHYAPRTRLCEVVIDNLYKGIYVFTEKIKRDSGRVALAPLDSLDNYGMDRTGGYIFKVDYWNSSNSWQSNYTNPNYPSTGVHFVYNYPDVTEITPLQKTYIQNWVNDFETALWGGNYLDSMWGYKPYIDLGSFVDYFIIGELSHNVDAYKKSRYFSKNRDDRDPLIHAGPVWDFDWAYKNISSSMLNGVGWQYNYSGASDVKPPGWYIRMMQDTAFANALACRYFTLRNSILDTNYLFHFIDSIGQFVNQAQARHYARWPILGINVGTPEVDAQPTTYAGELVKIKTWLTERLNWLDANMPGTCSTLDIHRFRDKDFSVRIQPNPSGDMARIMADAPIMHIDICDITGRLIEHVDADGAKQMTLSTTALRGVFILKVRLMDGALQTLRMVSE